MGLFLLIQSITVYVIHNLAGATSRQLKLGWVGHTWNLQFVLLSSTAHCQIGYVSRLGVGGEMDGVMYDSKYHPFMI